MLLNLITSRGHHNTYSYQVTSISVQQSFHYCTNRHTNEGD